MDADFADAKVDEGNRDEEAKVLPQGCTRYTATIIFQVPTTSWPSSLTTEVARALRCFLTVIIFVVTKTGQDSASDGRVAIPKVTNCSMRYSKVRSASHRGLCFAASPFDLMVLNT